MMGVATSLPLSHQTMVSPTHLMDPRGGYPSLADPASCSKSHREVPMGLCVWDDTYFPRGRSPYPAGGPTNGGTGRTLEGVLEEGPAIAPDDERVPVSSSGDVAPGPVAELTEISGGEGAGDGESVAPEEPPLIQRERPDQESRIRRHMHCIDASRQSVDPDDCIGAEPCHVVLGASWSAGQCPDGSCDQLLIQIREWNLPGAKGPP